MKIENYYNNLDLQLDRLYFLMKVTRTFEQKLIELYNKGFINGTIHTYIGQEANAAAIVPQLEEGDGIFSNHRCHGHFIVNTFNCEGLLAEILGKKGGVCQGRGGSQHLHQGNFYSNGVQGSIVPNAAGFALSQKINKTKNITVTFIGDGTLGEGIIYETMNMCSLWDIPLLIVCENNGIAQTTETIFGIAGEVIKRAEAFNIETLSTDTTDCEIIYYEAEKIIKKVRETSKPFFWEIKTIRLGPHSKGDDTRDPTYLSEIKEKDPLFFIKEKVKNHADIDSFIDSYIDEISNKVLKSEYIKFDEM